METKTQKGDKDGNSERWGSGPLKKADGNGCLELGWGLVPPMAPLCAILGKSFPLSGPQPLHLNKWRGLISDILGCCVISLMSGRRAGSERTVWGLQTVPRLPEMGESEM